MSVITGVRGQHKVSTLTGATMEVMSAEERTYYRAQQVKYTSENSFTLVSDLTDLERLLAYELQVFRINRWMSSGRDYEGLELPLAQLTGLHRQLKELAAMISAVKADLGLTRALREKGKDDAGAYIIELKRRAKEFGIHRETQLTRALCLANELKSLVGTFDRANATERDRIGLDSEADIVEWVRAKFIPEFDAVDEHFRTHAQRHWVGKL